MPISKDVVVVGAGVIGCSIAYSASHDRMPDLAFELAERG